MMGSLRRSCAHGARARAWRLLALALRQHDSLTRLTGSLDVLMRPMYLDDLPSTRVTDMRRSGALTPEMTHIAVTLQGEHLDPREARRVLLAVAGTPGPPSAAAKRRG